MSIYNHLSDSTSFVFCFLSNLQMICFSHWIIHMGSVVATVAQKRVSFRALLFSQSLFIPPTLYDYKMVHLRLQYPDTQSAHLAPTTVLLNTPIAFKIFTEYSERLFVYTGKYQVHNSTRDRGDRIFYCFNQNIAPHPRKVP
jgi:hypothetical protein